MSSHLAHVSQRLDNLDPTVLRASDGNILRDVRIDVTHESCI